MTLQDAPSARPPVSRLAKWFWRLGFALAVFVLTIAAANYFDVFVKRGERITPHNVGHDFIAFYTAGTFVNQGRLAEVYDLDKLRPFQRQLIEHEHLGIGDSFGPFWNPPLYAWVFAPLAKLGYFTAWWIWFWINIACLLSATAILTRMLRDSLRDRIDGRRDWTVWGLVPLLISFSQPAIQSLGHGQNTSISLLILSTIVWFWRKDQRMLAGMTCGLLFYKPQLALVVAGIVCITLGWRAMLGLAITGIILLALSEATLPGMMRIWSARLPALVKVMQVERVYMWERHVTLKAFWRLLLQGFEAGVTKPPAIMAWLISIAALSLGMTFAVVRTLLAPARPASAGRGSLRYEWLIAATLVAMPLLMPFYFDYDLLLLAVAAVLFSIHWTSSPDPLDRLDRCMLATWITLFVWMFINPFIGRWTHVNGTVLLLMALAGMLMTRASRVASPARVTAEPPTKSGIPALAI